MPQTYTRVVNGAVIGIADVNNGQIGQERSTKGIWNVYDYGAVAMRYYEGGTATASSATLSHPSASFVTGEYIYLLKGSNGAGANDANTQNIPLTTTYTYASGTTITMAANCGRTLTGVARFALGTDQTSAIQSAIDAAGAAGGGVVYVPAGYYICGPIILRKRVVLMGAGKRSTVLVRPASAGGTAHVRNEFTLSSSVETAQNCGVVSLCLDGNGSNQTTKAGCYGIWFAQSNNFSQTTYDELFDTWQLAEHVIIQNTGDTGFYGDGASEHRLIDVFVYYSQGSGFRPASDSFLHMCTAAETVNNGFLLQKNSLRLTNCKAFFSGRRGGRTNDSTTYDHTAAGFLLDQIAQGAVTINCCEAQDCGGAGFHFRSSTRVTLTGCVCDSNSAIAVDAYPAYYFYNSNDNIVEGCISFDRFTPSGTGSTTAWNLTGTRQLSAVSMNTTCARNRVSIEHSAGTTDGSNYAVIGPPVKITGAAATPPTNSDSTANNDLRFNNQQGMQTVAWAATMTVDPYVGGYVKFGAMTSNATVNMTTNNLHPGLRVMMEFTQDNTTNTHTITFGASGPTFKTGGFQPTSGALSNNKVSSVEFIYDGTNYVQFGSTLNM